MKHIQYDVVKGEGGRAMIKITRKDRSTSLISPEEVSAFILREMKKVAESKLDKKIKYAVVTVPAYFNDA